MHTEANAGTCRGHTHTHTHTTRTHARTLCATANAQRAGTTIKLQFRRYKPLVRCGSRICEDEAVFFALVPRKLLLPEEVESHNFVVAGGLVFVVARTEVFVCTRAVVVPFPLRGSAKRRTMHHHVRATVSKGLRALAHRAVPSEQWPLFFRSGSSDRSNRETRDQLYRVVQRARRQTAPTQALLAQLRTGRSGPRRPTVGRERTC